MERTMRKNTNWLRKFAWHRRDSADNISLDHGLYPESYFREKLVEERMRAERSSGVGATPRTSNQALSKCLVFTHAAVRTPGGNGAGTSDIASGNTS